jgi:hypothetical protein
MAELPNIQKEGLHEASADFHVDGAAGPVPGYLHPVASFLRPEVSGKKRRYVSQDSEEIRCIR